MDNPALQPDAEANASWAELDTLSIYQRARRLPRERIIVAPLCWTRLQLDLLGCSFSPPNLAPPGMTMKLASPTDFDRLRLFNSFSASTYWDRDPWDRECTMEGFLGRPDGPLETL